MLQNMKIKTKILAGFGAVVCLFLIVTAVGYGGLEHSREQFAHYRELARDTHLAGGLQANMLMLRMNVKDFIITGSQKNIEQYNDYLKKMKGFLSEAEQEIQHPERAARIKETGSLLAAYEAAFERVVGFKKEHDSLIYSTMDPMGKSMRETLTKLKSSAFEAEDFRTTYYAGRIQENLILGRLYVGKFLNTNGKLHSMRAIAELEGPMQENLDALHEAVNNPEWKTLLARIESNHEPYIDNFKTLVSLINTRNGIINDQIDLIGPQVAKLLEDVNRSVKADQDALGTRVIADIEAEESQIIIASVLAIVFGVFSAFFISGLIAKPMIGLTEIVEKISSGDLDVEVKKGGDDEVGHLSEGIRSMLGGLKKADLDRVKAARAFSMVENSPQNMMFVDNDFILQYLNPASIKALRKLEHLLPCKVDDLQGFCIDGMHKDPGRIRRLVADPSNLPHEGIIQLGEETLSLTAVAIFDDEGKRLGTMANWSVITQQAQLEATLKETVSSVSAAAEELSVSSREMRSNSEATTSRAETVERVSTETNGSVQSVAAAADELSVTVREISKNVQEANQITSRAVSMADAMNTTITKLDDSSQEIGKVIKVISTIAGQTNLLALNATIEAARAGDAGKGFAVVANEVKDLAKGTSSATEQIRHQIGEIQTNTQAAVMAIQEISSIIKQNSEISTSIASAVEQQAATTDEISSSMANAAEATQDVALNIGEIKTGAEATTSGADNMMEASQELSRMSGKLAALVEKSK